MFSPTTTRHHGAHDLWREGKAKVTLPDLLCRTLHSFWPFSHSCPLLFVLGCHSRLSSHAHKLPRSSYLHSLLASLLVNLFSSPIGPWSTRLAATSLLRWAPFSPPRPRCLTLAPPSSSPYTLATSPSLPYPRCIVVAPTSHLRTPQASGSHCWLWSPPRPLQVLYLLQLRALLPSMTSIPTTPFCVMSSALFSCWAGTEIRPDARNLMQEMRDLFDLARETSMRVMRN